MVSLTALSQGIQRYLHSMTRPMQVVTRVMRASYSLNHDCGRKGCLYAITVYFCKSFCEGSLIQWLIFIFIPCSTFSFLSGSVIALHTLRLTERKKEDIQTSKLDPGFVVNPKHQPYFRASKPANPIRY